MTVAAPALAQTMHALQIRGSVTTGLISVCCPCQADPIDTRSPDRWKNDDGRVETNAVFIQHLANAGQQDTAKAPAEPEAGR